MRPYLCVARCWSSDEHVTFFFSTKKQENRNVLQLRDKIKNFLASQGMIKGHSGSGARSGDHPPILRLTITTEAETPPYHSGSSSSPPARSQTLSEDYAGARSRHPTSHTRGSNWNNGIDQAYHPNGMCVCAFFLISPPPPARALSPFRLAFSSLSQAHSSGRSLTTHTHTHRSLQ